MNKQNLNRKIASIILISTLASPIFFLKDTDDKLNYKNTEYTEELPDWFIVDNKAASPNELYDTINNLPEFVKEIMENKNTTINLIGSDILLKKNLI